MYHDLGFKGVADAIAVLARYHERFPDVAVLMFGAIPRGSDVPDWIEYCHDPAQADLVESIYNRGTIYLSASVSEGWGLPPAEAMACGCAFVGTDIGGFREFATHGETALLSAPGDRDGMLGNLISLTENEFLRNTLQKAGTNNIQRFTWDRAGAELERFLTE